MYCALFGHHDALPNVAGKLKEVLVDLIENKGATFFYVGSQGNFDLISANVLRACKKMFPHIDYCVVLAYMPVNPLEDGANNTLYPFALVGKPAKFAIVYRNRWMVENADCIIAYKRREYGGVANAVRYAKTKSKQIIVI